MNQIDPTEDRLTTWLQEEASGELPDWVLGATFERTRHEVQRISAVGRFRSHLHDMGQRPGRRSTMVLASRAAAVVALIALGTGVAFTLRPASTTGPGIDVAAESPSPSPAASVSPSPAAIPDPMATSFFTGNAPVAGACQIATPTMEVVDGVIRKRGESWGCLTYTTDDPRFTGVSRNTFNTNDYLVPAAVANGRLGTVTAGRERIENDAGAWEGTWTELRVGSEFDQTAGWFTGEGAYDGLLAYVVITDALASAKVWGVIKPDDGLEAPTKFAE